MPLVEENRRLHDQLRSLKQELHAQQVRWDEYLTQAPTVRNAVSYVEVKLDFSELFTIERQGIVTLLEKKLAEALIATKPFYTVKEADGGVLYRFAIFAGSKRI